MTKPLTTGCDCGKLSMVWRHAGGRWRGQCGKPTADPKPGACGATSWASTWESAELDRRAEVSRG
jgi:hypothetical protein